MFFGSFSLVLFYVLGYLFLIFSAVLFLFLTFLVVHRVYDQSYKLLSFLKKRLFFYHFFSFFGASITYIFKLFAKMFFGSFSPVLFYVLGDLFLTFFCSFIYVLNSMFLTFLLFLGFLIKVTNFYLFRRKDDSFIIFFIFWCIHNIPIQIVCQNVFWFVFSSSFLCSWFSNITPSSDHIRFRLG